MKNRDIPFFLIAFFVLAGFMFLWLAAFEFYSWWSLTREGVHVQASITEARHNPCNGRGCSGAYPYEVKYQFIPAGQSQHYSYYGQWMFKELWARVPEATYKEALTSKVIDVTYSASQPRVNRPAILGVKPATEWLIFGVLALLSFGLPLVLTKERSNNSSGPASLRGGVNPGVRGPVRETALSVFLGRFARLTQWMFQSSRPQFHYALLVLYHAGAQLVALWLVLSLFAFFGDLQRINFDIVFFIVGPLALGALASGHVKAFLPMSERIAHWVVPGTYGGVCALTFWIVVRLRWDSVDVLSCLAAFIVGAAFFILLAWLMRIEERKRNAE